MDVEEFEQNVLKLAFETDVRITTASVAYYLGISSTEASPMLDELLERGVLELDSDSEGNLYYRVVDAAAPDAGDLSQLRRERINGVDGGAGADLERASLEQSSKADSDSIQKGPHLIGNATVEDDPNGDEAFSPEPRGEGTSDSRYERGVRADEQGPSAQGGGTTGTVGDRGVVRGGESRSDKRAAGSRPSIGAAVRREESGGSHGNGSRERRTQVVDREDPLAGVTRARGATDAVVDSCGDESMVVQSEARCEPRPFANSSPVVASCSERRRPTSSSLVPRNREATAVGYANEARAAAAGTTAAASSMVQGRRETGLEKPEHQPGMSLLLSLILCGTGQIYNGEVSKGIMMMVLCFLLWFVLLGWVVHIWSIVDSVVVAERINRQSDER